MPKSFLVKKKDSSDKAHYNYSSYKFRDIYDGCSESLKAVTPYTPSVLPLTVRVNNGYIHNICPTGMLMTADYNRECDSVLNELKSRTAEIATVPEQDRGIENQAEPIESAKVPKVESANTYCYTYDAFFVSDGRSRRRSDGENNDPNINQETAVKRQRYVCSECGKHYATSSNLSRHKQTHRSLDSSSAKKCPHCDKTYVSMPALSMHILTHDLKHKCGVCGKAFSRPWLLQGHLRSHSGEKPFGCAHCGKAFADRSNLRAHMQTHSAFKNFQCKKCKKTFALKSYLNKHIESACMENEHEI